MRTGHRTSIWVFFSLLLLIVWCFPSDCISTEIRLGSLRPKDAIWPEKGAYLVSPNETFFAGFYRVGYNAYAFAIWYGRIAGETVVWMANRNNPVHGWESTVILKKNGNLVLTDPVDGIVWDTNTGRSDHVVDVVLLETGNLVLRSTGGNYLWESFDHPTDTLLPQQPLRQGASLSSSTTFSTYATGYYRLFFDNTNILSLSFNGNSTSVYWPDPDLIAYTSGRSHFNSNRQALLDEFGGFKSSDGYSFNTSDFGETAMRRLKLDADGNLRVYSWDSNSSAWSTVWEAFIRLCKIHGICGPNGICTYDPQPRCACPPGFRVVNRSNWFEGCLPVIPPRSYCSQSNITFQQLLHTDYYGNDLDTYKPYQTMEQCKYICLNDCRCKGFAYRLDGMGKCFPKGSLLNGFQSAAASSTMYIKMSSSTSLPPTRNLNPLNLTCPPAANASAIEPPQPAKPNRSGLWKVPTGVLVLVAVLEAVCLGLGWWYLFKSDGKSEYFRKYSLDGISGVPASFSFAQLEAATNNFSEVLGKGGFGTVYKGTLPDNRAVAVKKLEGVSQGEVQFRAEVTIVGKIHHMNLVRMLGFCAEGGHRLLVYEYIPNGSLDKYLFMESQIDNGRVLDWNERFGIAVGTAKGIAYLHEECLDWILHCDIKPQNILLDDNFVPKVSDFGLAKLVDRERTLCFSTIRGTRGYLAPEWVRNLPITAKADVYSFGIVLLEIVTGQNSTTFNYYNDGQASGGRPQQYYFPQWAVEKMQSGNMRDLVDPKLIARNTFIAWEQVDRVLKTAFWCTQNDKDLRPAMGRVVQMLEGTMEIFQEGVVASTIPMEAIPISSDEEETI